MISVGGRNRAWLRRGGGINDRLPRKFQILLEISAGTSKDRNVRARNFDPVGLDDQIVFGRGNVVETIAAAGRNRRARNDRRTGLRTEDDREHSQPLTAGFALINLYVAEHR